MFFDETARIDKWPGTTTIAENCPLCGAFPVGRSYNLGAIKSWACGTSLSIRTNYGEPYGSKPAEKKEYLHRENPCYNRQILRLTALLPECVKEKPTDPDLGYSIYEEESCTVCGFGQCQCPTPP